MRKSNSYLAFIFIIIYFLVGCNKNQINTPLINYSGCDSIRLGILKPKKQDSIRLASCIVLSHIDSVRLFTSLFLKKGLVAWYPFTGNENDSSGNNYNGTAKGAVLSSDRFGKPNSAYIFSFGSFITLPCLIPLSNASQSTFSFWCKYPNGIGITQNIFTVFSGNGDIFGINFGIGARQSTNMDTINMYDNKKHISSDFPNFGNNWNHIVIIYDGTKPNFNVTFYQNGDLYISKNLLPYYDWCLSPSFANLTGNETFCIGSKYYNLTKDVVLDEFRIYKRILTQNEISYLATH